LEEIGGSSIHQVLLFANTSYYLFQIAALYMTFVFLDYNSYKDIRRVKWAILIAGAMTLTHIVLLVLNLKWEFYFIITDDNRFEYGNKYFIHLLISYLPFVLDIIDMLLSRDSVTRSQVNMILLFLIMSSVGSTLGLLMNSTSIFWPCFTACLLSVYFFIMETDAKIDTLTGIGNRYMFSEFLDQLNRQNDKQSWNIVMIDIDKLHAINDTLGHLEGDNALRDIATIIKGCIRTSDLITRYGSDEFVLAVHSEFNIEKIMERIKNTIKNQNEKNIRPYKLKISYSSDTFTTNTEQSVNAFLARIDSLLHKQKNEKRRISD
jgi:diguanylate cyclase (GGDEF)-like protein